AVIGRELEVNFRAEGMYGRGAERRRDDAAGEKAMADIADDDALGVERMPLGRADIDRVRRWQSVGDIEVGRDDRDHEGTVGDVAAGVAGGAGHGGCPDREGAAARRQAIHGGWTATAAGRTKEEHHRSRWTSGRGGDVRRAGQDYRRVVGGKEDGDG